MYDELQRLSDLDHAIQQVVSNEAVNPEEITQLVDTRERILLNLLEHIRSNPEFASTEQWKTAIHNTKVLVELMQTKTLTFATELKKYRHGNKSVQQYKKFL